MTRGFAVFAGILRGVLEKVGVRVWFFDGENVVECVVSCGGLQRLFWR